MLEREKRMREDLEDLKDLDMEGERETSVLKEKSIDDTTNRPSKEPKKGYSS
jgi:hypothetical protein